MTFVLSIGLLVKATQLVVKGLPVDYVLRFLMVSLPESFAFTIPLASLVSALLLFGRLSADGEISAMRSCGVNIWRIMTPLIIFGILLTALSIYVNNEVAPRGSDHRHSLVKNKDGVQNIVKLLEPGRFIKDFNGVDLWFERKDGDNLSNLLILEKMKNGATRETRCEKAYLTITNNTIILDMHKVRITPVFEDQPGTATAEKLKHTISIAGDSVKNRRRKAGDYTGRELTERIEEIEQGIANKNPAEGLHNFEIKKAIDSITKKEKTEEIPPEIRDAAYEKAAREIRSEFLTEYNRRLALGMAPIAFILLGMPLGIRSSRRESNIGIAISLGIMLLYYALMIAAKSLSKYDYLYPHIVIWLPTVVSFAVAAVLIRKNQ